MNVPNVVEIHEVTAQTDMESVVFVSTVTFSIFIMLLLRYPLFQSLLVVDHPQEKTAPTLT